MRKTMCGLVLAGILLAWGQTVLADAVGQKITQTEAFRHYVTTTEALKDNVAQLDAAIAKQRGEVPRADRFWLPLVALVGGYGLGIYPLTLLGLLSMFLYIVYLVKWHPMKWKLSTSARTFGLLWAKILRRNGVLCLLVALPVLTGSPARAGTNVLQDLSMYYTGNQFEKGYLLCKYAKGPIDLGYEAVGGMPVISRPAPGFERAFDQVAHLLGLGQPVSAGEMVALYDQARDDAQRRIAYALAARTGKTLAQAAGEGLVEAIGTRRGISLDACIGQFKALLTAYNDSDNRLLGSGLVKTFLEKAVGRVRNPADLDALVTLAVEHGAFAVIRDPVAKALQAVPPRLSFADTVHVARVLFHVDKDRARSEFASIRFSFRDFARSRGELAEALAGLMRDLSGVAAFLPLYDNDALYKALQQQPNAGRVAVTGLFDTVDKKLAAVAYGSIATGEDDLIFLEPGPLVTLAGLAATYDKDKTAQLRTALARTVVGHSVPYTREQLFAAVTAMGQSPTAFVEDVLTADMAADVRPGRNDGLRLALIETLPPERLPAYEPYFAKHTELAPGLLPFLYARDKGAFYRLLDHVFAQDAKSIASLRLPNESFDLKAVAPAFGAKALATFDTVPASLLFAQHALAGSAPDIKLVRRALIPTFDALFRDFLVGQPKGLSEEQALEALVLLSVVEEPGGDAFKKEAFLLGKLLEDYFSGAIGNGQTALKAAVAEREKALEGLRHEGESIRTLVRLGHYLRFYAAVLALYLVAGTILSLLFACNQLLPGKNFYLLHGVGGFLESLAAFLMATLVFFPAGFVLKLLVQLILVRANTPELSECVACLEAGQPSEEQPETP